jgi:hypothetical protein
LKSVATIWRHDHETQVDVLRHLGTRGGSEQCDLQGLIDQ